jgi:FkbM family methyltransferase
MGIGAGWNVAASGESKIVKRALKKFKNPVIIDAGANQGQYLTVVKEAISKKCIVHSFEPVGYTFSVLQKRCGHYSDVTLNNVGLGSKNEEKTIYYNKKGSGLASLSKRVFTNDAYTFRESETVSIITLDDYCKKNKIDTIALLKMDVEGYEFEVLKGAQAMLKENRIRALTFEFGGCNIDSKVFFRDFYILLTQNHYSLYRVCPAGNLYSVIRYSEFLEQFQTTNYYAELTA